MCAVPVNVEQETTSDHDPALERDQQQQGDSPARTISTQTPRPPMSADEAKEILGDEQRWYEQVSQNLRRCNKAPLRTLCPAAGRTEQVKRVIWSKLISCVKISKGPGATTGSHYHSITIDLVNAHVAKSIFWNLPRSGPTKRGDKICYNWEAKVEHITELAHLLSFEDHRLSLKKGQDNVIMRSSGNVMVSVIPPFLVEHRENKYDVQELMISFYTLELNPRGVLTWQPMSNYLTQAEYTTVEQHNWAQVYKLWRDLPQGESTQRPGELAWHTMNHGWERLAKKVRRSGVPISDEEDSDFSEDWETPSKGSDSDEDELLLPPPKQRRRT